MKRIWETEFDKQGFNETDFELVKNILNEMFTYGERLQMTATVIEKAQHPVPGEIK